MKTGLWGYGTMGMGMGIGMPLTGGIYNRYGYRNGMVYTGCCNLL